jgi:hypothetical protein
MAGAGVPCSVVGLVRRGYGETAALSTPMCPLTAWKRLWTGSGTGRARPCRPAQPTPTQENATQLSDPSLTAEILDDLYSFDPATMAWTLLSAAPSGDPPPVARSSHGFIWAGGKLYVHGGYDLSGICVRTVVAVRFCCFGSKPGVGVGGMAAGAGCGSVASRCQWARGQNKHTFLFIEMINKAGNLRRGMAGIEPTPSKS